MKILGIDVGIKNLGYCIIGSDQNICKPLSQNWNIINLLEDVKVTCCGTNCTNNPTKTCMINDIKYYFCGKHKKLYQDLINSNPIVCLPCEKSVKCEHTMSCKTKSMWVFNKKNICDKHWKMTEKNLIKERSYVPYKLKVDEMSKHDIKVKLIQKLEEHKELFLNVDYVLIENQPMDIGNSFRNKFKKSTFNPTMKSISDTIYAWFLINGEALHPERINPIVKFYLASNKLKVNDKQSVFDEKIENSNKKYKTRKILSVEETINILKHKKEELKHLESFKKQDDICDAFLHAVSFVQNTLKLNTYKGKKLLLKNMHDTMEKLKNKMIHNSTKMDHLSYRKLD